MCTVFARLLPSPILFIGPLELALLILFVTPCTTFRFLTGLSCGIYSWLQISQHIACTHVCIENSASYLLSKQITQSDKIELICSWLVDAVCDTSYWFFFVYLKGSFTIFLFSVRSHILNSNGVWYSWFWPEVPGDKIKTQKSWVWGVYRPLRAKSPIPHPITIQNMRSDQK